MIPSQPKYDVIIIGAGMAGLSAAYNLMGKAENVLICEQETPGHAGSSSYGESRMYREMYSDPWLCEVARKSNRLWGEMEKHSGKTLRASHGLLFYGEDWGEETIEGSIGGAKNVMLEQGIPFEELDTKAIEQRFPLACEDHWWGLFEPMAGAIMINHVFEYWLSEIKRAGFELATQTRVMDFKDERDGVVVNLADGTVVRADKLILTAGPWTKTFFEQENILPSYSVWQMLWAYYEIDESFVDAYPQWFNFQKKAKTDPDQGLYYGFPCLERNAAGKPIVKVGIDWTSEEYKTPGIESLADQDPNQLLDLMDTFVDKYLDGVIKREYFQFSPYTMSPDVQFCIDKFSDNVAFFSHGSGQAFKFAPIIGQCLAGMTTNGEVPIDLSPWQLSRLV